MAAPWISRLHEDVGVPVRTGRGAAWRQLVATPAASQTAGDELIVPGQRIGKWTLAMSVEAIVKVLGEPSLLFEGLPDWMVKTQPGVLAYDWRGSFSLGLVSRDDRTILALYASGTNKYKAATGVKIGAPLGSVESAYGNPTATVLAPYGSLVIYDRLGLAARYWNRSIGVIAVFRPGNAKRIWKF
jgi:hypothetical protein